MSEDESSKGEREAKSQVAYLDRDGDGQVDQDEYADAMLALMENLDDETFDEGVRKVLTAVTFASSSRRRSCAWCSTRWIATGPASSTATS